MTAFPPDLIILDDPYDTATPEERAAAKLWFAELILGRGLEPWQRRAFVGLDLASDGKTLVYALDRRINIYGRGADPESRPVSDPPKPSHRSNQLDRLAQSRAAKAAMLARVRK